MKYLFFKRFFLTILTLFTYPLLGQEVHIQLGPDKIGVNQAWTITVTIEGIPLKNYSGFPDIEGFRKGGTSTQSQTSITNGQVSSSQSIIMRYLPAQQGVFTLPSFSMKINGQGVSSSGKRIHVGAPAQRQQIDPFQNFFNRDMSNNFFGKGEAEFVDVKEDAFLALTTSKSEVYVGEGFSTTLSFFIAEGNRAPMQFYNLGKQLSRILKKIKPSNCWEENFNIEDVKGEPIQIKNRRYTQYKVYQATFYPLNEQQVHFPSVGLKMIKFKVAKTPSFFGNNRKEGYKTFYSKPRTVRVKKLPPHPLRESVAVGDYHLDEQLGITQAKTGQSVSYNFGIYGEGNISAIEKIELDHKNNFDFYDPNIKQSIRRIGGHVNGVKSFNYYMIPKEPGSYFLGDYFKWIFFNPKTHKYDTLQSKKTLIVTGESQKNISIENSNTESFYDIISTTDNALLSFHPAEWIKIGANIFIVLIFITSLFLFFKK